jgi:hypothetical protein
MKFECEAKGTIESTAVNGSRVYSPKARVSPSAGLAISYLHVRTRPIIAQSGKRLATGWTTEGPEFECQYGQDFFLHVVETGSRAYPASYPMGTEGSFPEGKAAVA